MPKPEPKRTFPPHDSRSGQRPPSRPAPAPVAVKSGVPHGATESGWLPDLVYTGEKFEAGLAFFADSVGRITRFSREPADLAQARRLEGQAALPGLVNVHSHGVQRAFRGRLENRGTEATTVIEQKALARISDEDVFDIARMAFMEMLLSGVTCVGEFHYLHHRADGTAWPDPAHLSRELMRAAHDVGIRIALLRVAYARGDFRADAGSAPARYRTGAVEQFVRETEALRAGVEKEFPVDEAWLGVGVQSLAAVPLDQIKVIATYARSQRLRLHAHISATVAENAGCVAELGKTPIALLAEQGVIDKRFTAIEAAHLTDEEIRILGAARASVGLSPSSSQSLGNSLPLVEALLAAGAGVAFGSDSNLQIDLLKEARLLELQLRSTRGTRTGMGPESATALFHAATVTGARSLGATGGALEVGRPADFFTVNLYDPSIAGADPSSLLAAMLCALERRAIRDVWVGARQRISNGRHVAHGPIVGRFVDTQRRIWAP